MARATPDLNDSQPSQSSQGANVNPQTRGKIVARLVLSLVCLPFLAFGLFAANEGLNRVASGGEQGAFILLFGVLFSAVPVALVFGARRHKRDLAEQEQRRQLHPDEPWRWTTRWDDGRIRCDSRKGLVVAWLFALVWNAFTLPLLTVVPDEIAKGNRGALFALLFPLAGFGLLVWAVRATLRWRRFGASVFELSTRPGVLGGALAGTLHVGAGLAGVPELKVRIACIRRRVTGSGKSRTTDEDLLWADEDRLPGSALQRGPQGMALPLRLALPYDAQPSDPFEDDDRVLWRLDVSADTPGVDYAASFEVPVFRTPESDPERTAAALSREIGENTRSGSGELSPEFAPQPHPEGGAEVLFPAGRHNGVGLMVTLFAAVFGGATWLLHTRGAPFWFTLIFGLSSLGVAFGAANLFFGSTRLRVRRDGVQIESRMPFYRSRRHVAREEILAVEPDPGMRSGNRVWWDLRIRTAGPPRGRNLRPRGLRVSARLAEKREADRLAAWVAGELGL